MNKNFTTDEISKKNIIINSKIYLPEGCHFSEKINPDGTRSTNVFRDSDNSIVGPATFEMIPENLNEVIKSSESVKETSNTAKRERTISSHEKSNNYRTRSNTYNHARSGKDYSYVQDYYTRPSNNYVNNKLHNNNEGSFFKELGRSIIKDAVVPVVKEVLINLSNACIDNIFSDSIDTNRSIEQTSIPYIESNHKAEVTRDISPVERNNDMVAISVEEYESLKAYKEENEKTKEEIIEEKSQKETDLPDNVIPFRKKKLG